MNFGHSAAWDQLWDRACSYYRQALDEFPDNPAALTSLGLALFEMKDYDNALRIYHRAALASAQDPVPFEKIGKITERMGRLTDAVQAYIQAADLYLKARDVEKSIENWMQVLRLQESLVARTRLAMIYEKIGRKPQAVTEYLAAASLMQRAGDLPKAMQAAEYALQYNPESVDAQQAVIMLRNNQPLPRPNRPRGGTGPTRMAEVRQLETPANAAATPQDPISEARQRALVQMAALLFDQADETATDDSQTNRRGLSSLTKGTGGGGSLAQAERTRIQLHLGQAIDSQTKGEDAQAVEELERTIEAGLHHPAALFNLGLMILQKDPNKSLRYLQDAVKHPEFSLAAYLLMGKIRYDANNMPEAAGAYLQALRLADCETVDPEQADELRQLYEPIIETQTRLADPTSLKTLCESIHNQVVRPDWRMYMKMARQQLTPQPQGNPPLPLAEMLLESRSGQVIEMLAHIRHLASELKLMSAMEEAYHALQFAPTYLPLHIQIADLLLMEGRNQAAVDKLLLVADLYAVRGESGQAIRLFNRIIEIAPMDLAVRKRMIDLLLAQGKTETAVQQYINLAEIYYQLAELDMARLTYTTSLKVSQQARGNRGIVVQILYRIADIDMQRLDLRNALRVYEQIRTLEPEDVHGRACLIDINYRMGQEPAALNEVDGFLALLENSSKRDKAVDFLQEVLSNQPDKTEVRKRLAELCQHDGNNPEALRQWETIANQLINHGDRPGAIAALQTMIKLDPPKTAEYLKRIGQIQRFG
jgi:tetratricopeptide (TPR) repeat protein